MSVVTSIIVPVFNGERYLADAIESVLAQTAPNFELIIWDDGSTDQSFQIAMRYAQRDSRVQAFTAAHRGHAAALNAATAQTSGQYLGWVDSDDLLAPTALAETMLVLEAHPEIGLVYTDYTVIDEQNRERKYGGRCLIPYSKEKLLESFMTFHFRLFRRRVFVQVGGVDESLECAVDYDLCLKLSEVTEFRHLAKPLYYYRSHTSNVSHQKSEQQNRCSHLAIARAKERRGLTPTVAVASQTNIVQSAQVSSLSFYWSATKQLFACDDVFYANHGSTPTDPSHDLAHLLVAANGGLDWLPQRNRNLACLAEYNAVFLETLFDRTCNTVVFKTAAVSDTLAATLKHMDWFVNEHFAPFPTSAEAAYRQFCQHINPFITSRLFPYYLATKQYERSQPDHREAEYELSFTSTDQPATDEAGWLAQWSIYQQLKTAQAQQKLL